ncbi:MAG: hypothetical protein RI935_452 [Candidatus Parcubacteria bacterium]|jgi:hypothetical protein
MKVQQRSCCTLFAPLRSYAVGRIRKVKQGIDFLGYVILPHARVVRTKTKRRISRKLREGVYSYNKNATLRDNLVAKIHSYLGVFSYANSHTETVYLQELLRVVSLRK